MKVERVGEHSAVVCHWEYNKPRSASFCKVGMLMPPPNGDHAASPVSSYRTIRMLGAPSGAFASVYGAQSGLESRTSSLITPLNLLFAITCPSYSCVFVADKLESCLPIQLTRLTRSPSLWRIDHDISHRRSRVLRLIPGATALLIRKTIYDHSRACWREGADHRADNRAGDCGGRRDCRRGRRRPRDRVIVTVHIHIDVHAAIDVNVTVAIDVTVHACAGRVVDITRLTSARHG